MFGLHKDTAVVPHRFFLAASLQFIFFFCSFLCSHSLSSLHSPLFSTHPRCFLAACGNSLAFHHTCFLLLFFPSSSSSSSSPSSYCLCTCAWVSPAVDQSSATPAQQQQDLPRDTSHQLIIEPGLHGQSVAPVSSFSSVVFPLSSLPCNRQTPSSPSIDICPTPPNGEQQSDAQARSPAATAPSTAADPALPTAAAAAAAP
ncbi:hypothetical protein KVV02_006005 [Mortierella alpina]|uniref:Uncharacterized protein n=1 Tax=Mortierella alpina TaxID=64518 RepID=A0A9P8D2W6_MORAP|nr:hypothetical protein KVV02_006005 [Mortierella alpina]